MAVPFEAVDGKGFDLNDLNFPKKTGSWYSSTSDQIKLWDVATATYDTWYYYADEEYPEDNEWLSVVGDKSFSKVYPNGLPAGTVFWYMSRMKADGGSMTSSGAVNGDPTYPVEIVRGKYNFVSDPYPVRLDLNDTDQVSFAGQIGAWYSSTADQIKLWDVATATYDTWYYYADEEYPEDNEWLSVVGDKSFDKVYPNGLEVGQGFWYMAREDVKGGTTSFNAVFKNPIK